MNKNSEKTYVDLISQYKELNQKAKEIKELQDSIREKAAEMLHIDQINEKIVQLESGENWFCGYQTTTKSSTDLKLLLEYVGPNKYSEIVSEKQSSFISIRKAAKSKIESDLLHTKPVEDNPVRPFIPNGMVLS
jgi:hypothetical protein